jgi:subtilisin family serine protease
MDEIKLMRGGREVTFTKMPEHFAVRLKQGRARDAAGLEACCGQPKAPVRHVDSAAAAGMEVFAVADPGELEATVDELRAAPGSDVVTHMYALDDTPKGAVIPTGTLTLQFKPDVEKAEQEAILAEFGLEIVEDLDFLPHGYTVRLTDAAVENPLKIAAKLQGRVEVEVAEPDLSFQISPAHVPSDSLYPRQWHLKNRGDQTGLTAGADVKAEEAWAFTRGRREIVVCVMDDGFDLGHPDFSAAGKIVAPRDFGGDDFVPNPEAADDNHGTACAGVAIAEENGSGVVGLAPGCAFMPIRTSGWISDNAIVALFQYAMDNGADVISCSWTASAWNFPLSTKMHAIIKKVATQGRANGKGCVILFAAGNDDRPLDGVKDGQISVQGFGLHPNVLCVGASNSLDQRSTYSNFGPKLAFCAPSSGSPGRRIVTTDRRGIHGYQSGDYTFSFGGTSSATPLAAGLAALILSLNPDLTSAEVRQVMMATADKIDAAHGDYDAEGHSIWFGHGRINAYRALAMVDGDEEKLPAVLFVEHRTNTPIPDLGETEDTIPFPLDVKAREISVNVEIKHTWRGDLRLILRTPGGAEIVLQERSGAGEDDLVRSYRSTDTPDLFEPVLGTSAQGDWGLRVLDMAARDTGVLTKWGLAVTY